MATVAALIDASAARLETAGVFFGHGTDNARDEAAALVFHVLGLDHADASRAYRLVVGKPALERVDTLVTRRIETRMPLPYLTGEAWFGGLPYHVDPSVLVPRSPFAELIASQFQPWVEPASVQRILEIGTGSGCIAVALALAFPGSQVVATEISVEALAVAERNVRRHSVDQRVTLVRTDLYAGLDGTFDLIVANPPYVPEGEVADFPPEYAHEPRVALVSGPDGMETPVRILHHAGRFITSGGWLAIEVGAGAAQLESRFPLVPFIWPELVNGGDGIALVSADELRAIQCPETP